MEVVNLILLGLAVYATIGVAVAAAFVVVGVGRVDPLARQSSIGFRLLILPGSAALWPCVVKRWMFAPRTKEAQ